MFDIDLLSYAGNVALFDSSDPARLHRVVYGYPLTEHLRGLDVHNKQAEILQRRAADAYYSALYLPYFSVKPLYVLSMELVHKFGATVIDASRTVSAVFFFGIAVVLWLYTRSLLALIALVLPETMVLGQASEPDGMSAFLLLAGLWILFVRRKDIGVLPIWISVWVRPDNIIACIVILGVLYGSGRIRKVAAGALLSLAFGGVILISHYGYGWKSLYAHTFLGAEPMSVVQFGASEYLHALSKGLIDLLHSPAMIFGLLYCVCFRFVGDAAKQILTVSATYSALRFVVYPSYETRYYAVFFLTTAVAGVMLVSEGLQDVDWVGRVRNITYRSERLRRIASHRV
jgi:hypothetical protein